MTAPHAVPARKSERTPLREIALLFLKLGTTAFGGPVAHIAMMEDEVVRRRGWLTRERFLDYLGATNLIPGPNSTELAIHVGFARARWAGLLVAGTCFIVPAAIIVATLAWMYVRYGSLPQASAVLYGIKPVVIAVVLQALHGLARSAIKSRVLALVAVVSVAAAAVGVHELLVLAIAGLFMAALIPAKRDGSAAPRALSSLLAAGALGGAGAAAGAAAPFSLFALFMVFAKIGAVLFGSGYVLLAFMRTDLVDRLGWLTEAQLLDAVAVGLMTPGPVFTAATFVGYVVGGFSGAFVATVGIFLPAFVFVALSGPLVPRIRRSPIAGAFLDGLNVASLALMAVVTFHLARSALVDATTITLLAASAVLLVRFRINAAWLVLAGGAIGFLALR